MQKTKVVVIHNIVSPHVTKLFQEFSKLVDLTVLYCAMGEENRTWKGNVNGFKYKILPNYSIKFRGRDLFTYFINPTILQEIKKANPRVVIIAGWDIFAYQVAFIYCKIKGIKVILWTGSTKYEKSWRRALSLPLVKFIIWGSDMFLAYGSRAKEYLIENGAKSKNILNYMHTLDIQKYMNHKSHQTHQVKDKKIILYYGQLIERKGIDILFKAFESLLKRYKNLELYIVGSGQFKNTLAKLTEKLNISEQVKFIENPGDNKMDRYFSMADIFVLPSREEVWGLVVNQAMASGLPVIVSNSSGSSTDLIRNKVNGYIFKSGSVSDLKLKIELLLKHRNVLKRMGEMSLQIIKEWTPLNSAQIMNKAVQMVGQK
ncbi:MAG TPA: glycosyltransferase [Patescibacteria group bacterium]|nr:glycosyltransferase [Patescibacteria group bacterium]